MTDFIIHNLTTLTVAAAGTILFVQQLINGRSKLNAQNQAVSNETLTAYVAQVALLKDKQAEDKISYDATVEKFSKQISELTLRIGEQTGIIGEQQKRIDEYKEIFQNRNPDLLEVLKEIRTFMGDLHSKVATIEARSEQREIRDKAVDEGHLKAITNK